MLSVFFNVCVCVNVLYDCFRNMFNYVYNMYTLMMCAIVVCCCCDVFLLSFELIDIWLIFMLVSIVKKGKQVILLKIIAFNHH